MDGKNKGKKQYTLDEKKAYYKKIQDDPKATKEQKARAVGFLTGLAHTAEYDYTLKSSQRMRNLSNMPVEYSLGFDAGRKAFYDNENQKAQTRFAKNPNEK